MRDLQLQCEANVRELHQLQVRLRSLAIRICRGRALMWLLMADVEKRLEFLACADHIDPQEELCSAIVPCCYFI
jgi:hypothetical protein